MAAAVALGMMWGGSVCAQTVDDIKKVCNAWYNADRNQFDYYEVGETLFKMAKMTMKAKDRKLVNSLNIKSLFIFKSEESASASKVSGAVSELRAVLSRAPFKKLDVRDKDREAGMEAYCLMKDDGSKITDVIQLYVKDGHCVLMGIRGGMTLEAMAAFMDEYD